MKTLCGIGVMALLLAVPWAQAAGNRDSSGDGNALLEMCRAYLSVDNTGSAATRQFAHDAGYCGGLVDGMLGMYGAYVDGTPHHTAFFCLPQAGIRVAQGVRVVVRYLETHPERLHLAQRDLLIEAFRDVFPFPCGSTVASPPQQLPTGVPRPSAPTAGKGKQ